MLDCLTGRIISLESDGIVLQTGGVGWKILTTLNARESIHAGEEMTLHTHLAVNEHAFTLFGFCSLKERGLFRRLIKVNGIGPQSALCLLSDFQYSTLASLIAKNDVTALTTVKGIGKKTAERLIVELKESMQSYISEGFPEENHFQECRELCKLLEDLGFSKKEANEKSQQAIKNLGPESSIENMLEAILQTKK